MHTSTETAQATAGVIKFSLEAVQKATDSSNVMLNIATEMAPFATEATQKATDSSNVMLNIATLSISILGITIGWYFVNGQNKKQLDRQETWHLLQETLLLIDNLANEAIIFHSTGGISIAKLDSQLKNLTYSIDALFTSSVAKEAISLEMIALKEAITVNNWWVNNHILYPVESGEIEDITNAQRKLRKRLLDSYQKQHDAKRIIK